MTIKTINSNSKTKENKTHTTITLSPELYKKFCMKVIDEYGTRRNNDVIVQLIQDWVFEKDRDTKDKKR